jgi:hypothetical protein
MIHNSHEDTTVFLLIKQFPHEGAEITEGTDKTLDADIKQIKNILSQSRSQDKRRRGQEERRGKQLRELRVVGSAVKGAEK